MKRKSLQPRIPTQQAYHSDLREKSKLFKQAKVKNSTLSEKPTANTKGTPLGRKETSNLNQPAQL